MKIETKFGELPIRYNWNVLRKLGDEFNISMDEVLQMDLSKRSLSDVFTFALFGFREGARFEGVECKVKNLDDIGDMMDENPKILERALSAFVEDMKAMTNVEGSKKK